MSFKEYMQVAKEAARNASKVIEEMKSHLEITEKAPHDIVTQADIASQKIIIDTILAQYPDDGILGEEGVETIEGKKRYWVIDPIDGTVNYARGIPLYCISIGCVENNEIVAGVVYVPQLNEMYTAVRGEGAFCNDTKLSVSKRPLGESLVVFGDFNVGIDSNAKVNERMLKVSQATARVRTYGSAAIELSYVAAGKIDGMICQPYFWDCAAGIILIEEAGGKVSQHTGDAFDFTTRDLVATSGLIHKEIIQLLQ